MKQIEFYVSSGQKELLHEICLLGICKTDDESLPAKLEKNHFLFFKALILSTSICSE